MENKHTRSVSLIDGHIEDITDAEIIKALECCKQGTAVDCKECPLYEDKGHTCITILSYKSLDLINRQQAENSELQHKISELEADVKKLENIERFATKTIEKQDAEIEKLNVELVGMRGACESYKMHYDNAQAEIEKLKKENQQFADIGKMYSELRAEAIQGFAEKVETELDERVSENIRNRNPHWYIAKRIVRETAIEMTEVSE